MKRFISGFLLGALIFSVPALANNSKNIEAFYNNIKIKVYGQLVNTEGNEPFIVGGRTYVPARYVAEAMGGVVKWNETENIVEVTVPEPKSTPEPTKMTSDGIEAKYYYGGKYFPDGYYVRIGQITEKHNYFAIYYFESAPQNQALVCSRLLPSRKVLVTAYSINDSVNFPYDDYEAKILPLFATE